MDFLASAIDIFLHLDKHLADIIATYGSGWTYALIFVIIFCETGLVVAPFLPGDSLLFATGAFAASGALDIVPACVTILVAAVLGDATNYFIGGRLGIRVFDNPQSRVFKHEYLERTQAFYDKYGGKTIVIARFVPIVRSFAPFLAGVGKMRYSYFATWNVLGAALWVIVCAVGGYLFGNLPFVREHFSIVVLTIIVVSTLPGIIEIIRVRRARRMR